LLVLPYPYSDCVGGAKAIAEAFPVAGVLDNGWPRVNRHQEEARNTFLDKGMPVSSVRDGDSQWVDGVEVRILAPGSELVPRSPAAGNNSLVVQIRFGATAFLWEGGLERAGEDALLERGPARLHSQWLHVARQANVGSASAEFLEAVGPDIVLIPRTGNKGENDANFVLDRALATGARIVRSHAMRTPPVFLSDGAKVWQANP